MCFRIAVVCVAKPKEEGRKPEGGRASRWKKKGGKRQKKEKKDLHDVKSPVPLVLALLGAFVSDLVVRIRV